MSLRKRFFQNNGNQLPRHGDNHSLQYIKLLLFQAEIFNYPLDI